MKSKSPSRRDWFSVSENTQNTGMASCRCTPGQPTQTIPELESLFDRLQLNNQNQPRAQQAVVVHHTCAATVIVIPQACNRIHSLLDNLPQNNMNQSLDNINKSCDNIYQNLDNIHKSFDIMHTTIREILNSLARMDVQLQMLLQAFKQPGFLENVRARNQARIEELKVSNIDRLRTSLTT